MAVGDKVLGEAILAKHRSALVPLVLAGGVEGGISQALT